MGVSTSKEILSKEEYNIIFDQFKLGLATTSLDLSDEDVATYKELFQKLKIIKDSN